MGILSLAKQIPVYTLLKVGLGEAGSERGSLD